MRIVLFGINAFSDMVYQYLSDDSQYEVVGFTAERAFIKDEDFNNTFKLPLVPYEELKKLYPARNGGVGIIVCIGYCHMNDVRKRVFEMIAEDGYYIHSYVHPTATVLTSELGLGNIVLERACIGSCVHMGKGNIVYPMAHIAHHCEIGDYNFFAISSVIGGKTRIENNCFLGMNCSVKNRTTVQSYTLVGANCYISKNTEKNGVYVPPRSYLLDGKDSLSML